MNGNAPCKCGQFNPVVKLTGYFEPDGMGGENYECCPGQACPNCGEPFLWLHRPVPFFGILSAETKQEMDTK